MKTTSGEIPCGEIKCEEQRPWRRSVLESRPGLDRLECIVVAGCRTAGTWRVEEENERNRERT
jgi:hypothetical protein